MKINPGTGFFDIDPDETITITVTAANTKYMASFPPKPSCTSWSSSQGPTAKKESRSFVAPASGNCFVVIVFDFQPNAVGGFPPGAKYNVNVKGSNGGSFDDLPIQPPPPASRQYKFHVI
jgi:hypothetical protein